jgi:hypothetical protein
LEDVAKPKILADLHHLLAVVREHGDTPIAGFASAIREHVASASKGKSKKGAAPMDQSLVNYYLKKLDDALGDDVAFRALFREIDADKRVTTVEAVELATRFLGPTPPSTSAQKRCKEFCSVIRSSWTSNDLPSPSEVDGLPLVPSPIGPATKAGRKFCSRRVR